MSNEVLFVLGSTAWAAWIESFLKRTDTIRSTIINPGSVEEIIAAAKHNRPDAIIFLGHHETLERDASWAETVIALAPQVVCPNRSIAALAYNKRLMSQSASNATIVSPIQELTTREAHDRLCAKPNSVILKKVNGTEGKGFEVIKDVDRLYSQVKEYGEDNPQWMLQPFIHGLEVSVNIFRAGSKFGVMEPVDKGPNGENSTHPSRRVRRCPSPRLTQSQKENIYKGSEELASLFNFEGAGELEFIVTDESIYFLEINPRIAATMRMNFLACSKSIFSELAESIFAIGTAPKVIPSVLYSQEFPVPRGAERYINSGQPWPNVWITTRVTVVADNDASLEKAVIETVDKLGVSK